MTLQSKTTILKPRMSEKTYLLGTTKTVYTFEVPTGTSKQAVAAAVEAQFSVTVETVNVLNVKGKAKSSARKGRRPVAGRRSDFRKAYVTLKQGESLPFFETEDDKKKSKAKADKADAKDKEAKKDDKKADKKAGGKK